jgi:hypothetical protein
VLLRDGCFCPHEMEDEACVLIAYLEGFPEKARLCYHDCLGNSQMTFACSGLCLRGSCRLVQASVLTASHARMAKTVFYLLGRHIALRSSRSFRRSLGKVADWVDLRRRSCVRRSRCHCMVIAQLESRAPNAAALSC